MGDFKKVAGCTVGSVYLLLYNNLVRVRIRNSTNLGKGVTVGATCCPLWLGGSRGSHVISRVGGVTLAYCFVSEDVCGPYSSSATPAALPEPSLDPRTEGEEGTG